MGGRQGLAFVTDASGLLRALFCFGFDFSLANLIVRGDTTKEDSSLKRWSLCKLNNNIKSSEFSKVKLIIGKGKN